MKISLNYSDRVANPPAAAWRWRVLDMDHMDCTTVLESPDMTGGTLPVGTSSRHVSNVDDFLQIVCFYYALKILHGSNRDHADDVHTYLQSLEHELLWSRCPSTRYAIKECHYQLTATRMN